MCKLFFSLFLFLEYRFLVESLTKVAIKTEFSKLFPIFFSVNNHIIIRCSQINADFSNSPPSSWYCEFDMPDERKVHHAPIPRLGGLSFFPVMLITMGGLVLVPGSEILWNLWAGIVFFVKIVEMLGCLGELMYICNSLDSV